jgi:hypothetical protein
MYERMNCDVTMSVSHHAQRRESRVKGQQVALSTALGELPVSFPSKVIACFSYIHE